MTRPRLPALPLDQADRRILGVALVLVLGFLVLCVTIGAGIGLGMRAYMLLAGG